MSLYQLCSNALVLSSIVGLFGSRSLYSEADNWQSNDADVQIHAWTSLGKGIPDYQQTFSLKENIGPLFIPLRAFDFLNSFVSVQVSSFLFVAHVIINVFKY